MTLLTAAVLAALAVALAAPVRSDGRLEVLLGGRGGQRVAPRRRRAPSPDARWAAALADAPLAFDLLAACIAAGAAPEAALASVADAVGGPLGRLLGTVARAAVLGCPAEQAWAPLLDSAVPAPLREAAAGFIRAQRSGAALAPALGTIAAEQRRARRVAAQAAARRAGVLAVGPLGVCFLPAFVIVGVVPLVAGLIGAAAW